MATPSLLSTPHERHSSFSENSIRGMSSSCNTSGSSTASEVLKKSSASSKRHMLDHGRPNPSDSSMNSSHSSTGSVRVRIKAKYLKERKSPFEPSIAGSQGAPYLPPALPANLPTDYEAQRDVADVHRLNEDDNDVILDISDSHHSRVTKPAAEQSQNPIFQPSGSKIKEPIHLATRISNPLSDRDVPGSSSRNMSTITSKEESSAIHQPSTLTASLGNKTSGILRQGAPTTSLPSHGAQRGQPDIRVIQFSRGQRQQVMREQLLKKYEGSKPTKRYVQPKFIAGSNQTAGKQDKSNTQPEASNMAAATAAAAAAVAATMPLLKTQCDLESKMNQIMEKLSILEHAGPTHPPAPPWAPPGGLQGLGGEGYGARQGLEEATQLRLAQLDELQSQQRELQAVMIEMSRKNADPGARPVSRPQGSNQIPASGSPQGTSLTSGQVAGGAGARSDISPQRHHPEGVVEVPQRSSPTRLEQAGQHIPPSQPSNVRKNVAGSRVPPKPEKHIKYAPAVTFHRLQQGRHDPDEEAPRQTVQGGGGRLDAMHINSHGTQTSPLDTPAPRRHAPVPHAREHGAKLSHQGRGLLEEILTSHDEEERFKADRRKKQLESRIPVSSQKNNTLNSRIQFWDYLPQVTTTPSWK